jgi:hypothetical protein
MLFKKGMTSKQIAMLYYKICDSYTGEDKQMLDEAFNKAFWDAQREELEYAMEHTSDSQIYCAQ